MPASISRFSPIASERAPAIATVIHARSCALGAPSTARSAPTYANGSAKSVCSILTSDAKRRGMTAAALVMPAPAAAKPPLPFSSAAPSSLRRSRLPVRCRFLDEELQRVLERRPQDCKAVAATTGRTGQVDDQRLVDHAGDAAG